MTPPRNPHPLPPQGAFCAFRQMDGAWFLLACGGAGLIKSYDLHGYRRGGTFDSPKVPKSDLGLRPKNPTHRNARPENQRAVSRSVG